MIGQQSQIQKTSLNSPLLEASTLKPDNNKSKKNLVATVILTSLVDAFSILVIYLLVNFSNSGEIMYISNNIELPNAQQISPIERTTIVKVENNKFFVEEKEVDGNGLVAELLRRKKELSESQIQSETNESLVVQADKKLKYEILSQVVQASNHAGFSEVRFAVIGQ